VVARAQVRRSLFSCLCSGSDVMVDAKSEGQLTGPRPGGAHHGARAPTHKLVPHEWGVLHRQSNLVRKKCNGHF
jgi:hypothetical protein